MLAAPSFALLGLVSQAAAIVRDIHNINCKSLGISDGYQGHQEWRASSEHCQDAIDKLIDKIDQKVDASSIGCLTLSEDQTCTVSLCDDYNPRQVITYGMVWAAANAIHARHRTEQKVAGYVSLDDFDTNGSVLKRFVLVAKKGSPDPSNKRRRSLFGRRSELDTGELEVDATDSEPTKLETRQHRRYDIVNVWRVPNTDDLNINVIAAWGQFHYTPRGQMEDAYEPLLNIWRRPEAADASALVGTPVVNSFRQVIEYEFNAHQFQPVTTIPENERLPLLRYLTWLREGHNSLSTFAVQIRRGTRIIGHMIIRSIQMTAVQQLPQVCA